MKNVITLEEPHFLSVRLVVKLQLAVVASIALVDVDTAAQIPDQGLRVLLHVSSQKTLSGVHDVFCVAFLPYFVFKRLFELFKFHKVAFILQERYYFIQVDIVAHLLNKILLA